MTNPILHIVLFKFKPTASLQDMKDCFLQLQKLSKTMDEIKSFQWGTYQSKEGLNQGFTHGFTMSFDSEEDRDYYLTAPSHVEVAQFINRHLDSFPQGVIAFDSTFNNDSVVKRTALHQHNQQLSHNATTTGAANNSVVQSVKSKM